MADSATSTTTGPQVALSGADTLMWRIAADPVLRSPILVVGLLDRAPEPDRLGASIARAAALLPGLRSTIVAPATGLGRPTWVADPRFSVDHHIRWVGAVGASLRSVLDMAGPDAAATFDPERPPWSLTVVEGLGAERAAFLLRFHHAITDGMGGLQVAAHIFDQSRRPPLDGAGNGAGAVDPGPPPAETGPRPGTSLGARVAGGAARGVRSVASTAGAVARDPLGTAAASVELARSAGRLLGSAPDGSPLLAGRSLDRHLHTAEVPLAELRAAAKAAGGTINDVLLAAVGGAFRSYHRHHGTDVPTMSVTMPVDQRRPGDDPAGNHFAPVRFALPVDDPDPVTRVRIAGAIARSWRDEPALAAADVLAGGLNLLPGPVVTRVFGRMLRTVDADVVDLQGLVAPAYVGGARIERMWAFAPPTGAAFSVTLLSHLDAGCVAVACDRAAVADPELLADCLEASLDEVRGLSCDGEVGS